MLLVLLLGVAAYFVAPVSRNVGGQSLGVDLAVPTNLKATDSVYATKVGLHWEPVPYATLYRVFRSTTNDPQTGVSVGTTPANYWFDASATAAQAYFYWVRAENGANVSALSSGDGGMRAVGNNSPGPPFPPLNPPFENSNNPITAAKAYLGKTLFWDEQLSSTKTVSCGTCHQPAAGGSDPRVGTNTRHPGPDNIFNTADDIFGSPGVVNNSAAGNYSPVTHFGMNPQVTNRKSPSYLNAGYTTDGIFWDGRASDVFRDPITNNIILGSFGGLESQAVAPPLNTGEMGHVGRDWPAVVSRVSSSKPLALAHDIPAGLANWLDGRSYAQLFEEVFGTPDITPARIAMAIGTHERMLFSDQTPLDRWSAQLESLTAEEEQGRQLFISQQCNFCHGGALLSNATYQNVGVRPTTDDPGRGALTGVPADIGRFKTPPLRNLELKKNYFHTGRFANVEDVVEFYNRGGDFPAPNVDTRVRPLNLTVTQRAALVAFLKRPLTDDRVKNELPPFDRPKLFTESQFVPTITGTGRNGTNGQPPNAIALEPPITGNDRFTIAVSQTVGGANGRLVVSDVDPGVGTTIPPTGTAPFGVNAVTLSGSGPDGGYASAVMSIPNDPSLVGRTFYGRWYVNDSGATNGFSVSRLITFTVFGPAAERKAPFDFDGDQKTDLSIFRPSVGEWWLQRSSNSSTFAAQFGISSDRTVPADYTGDGKADIAFFRPGSGSWFVLRSEDFSFYAFPFGTSTDVTVPADYDGDGKVDPAIFRPSSNTWFIQRSSGGTDILGFGIAGDKPVPADYDGDTKADIAIFRPSLGEWWIRRSSTDTTFAVTFGTSTDKAVPGDFTGDGKADVAFWRPSTGSWFILRSEDFSFFSFPFGANGDSPVPGDYDGDGKIDAAIFRPSNSTWYINRSTAGTLIQQFGTTGDLPLPNSYVP
ncbi:MAG TPA: cytochrome c peroxidase [Pyrinomonadaceae bacterium]|mgnify:CR=1 FL=1|nr:cytochrome c peroxidase [Pyrinomonadaceae bacterium]